MGVVRIDFYAAGMLFGFFELALQAIDLKAKRVSGDDQRWSVGCTRFEKKIMPRKQV